MIIRTEYLDLLKRFKDKDLIKVITGVKRCGKSILFELFIDYLKESNIKANRIIQINLENPEYQFKDYMDLYNYVNKQIKAAITEPVSFQVGGFIGTSASAISNCVASSNIKVTTQKAESATIDKGLEVYNLNVGGFAGSTYDNVTRQIETVGFFGSIEVEAVPVYTTNVAGLIAELGNYIKVKDSVVKLNGLTISGPTLVEATEEATDGSEDGTTEEPAKKVEYKVTYGEIFAVRSSEEITTEYLEENQITSINQITPTLSGEESYRVSVPTYYVTVDDAFKEKYNTYYDGQSALIASYLE